MVVDRLAQKLNNPHGYGARIMLGNIHDRERVDWLIKMFLRVVNTHAETLDIAYTVQQYNYKEGHPGRRRYYRGIDRTPLEEGIATSSPVEGIMEPIGGAEGGIGLGTLLAGIGTVAFVAYTAYKISKKREELRHTIELLDESHDTFVNYLESLVATGQANPAFVDG